MATTSVSSPAPPRHLLLSLAPPVSPTAPMVPDDGCAISWRCSLRQYVGVADMERSLIWIEGETSFASAKQVTKRDADTAFAERARMLIKRGYKPKVAVELVLHEILHESGHGNDPRIMERARADAEE